VAGIEVKVGINDARFKAGLAGLKQQAASLGSQLKNSIGAYLGMAAVAMKIRSVTQEMDRLDALSKQFGESAETMQRVGWAAETMGTDLETVANGMRKVTKFAVEAAAGNKKYSEAFAALGIDAKAFINMPLTEKLLTLSKAFSEAGGSGDKLAAAQMILSRGGAEMLPMLQNTDALRAAMDEAVVSTNAEVAELARLNDEIDKFSKTATVGIGKWIMGLEYAAMILQTVIQNLSDISSLHVDLGGGVWELAKRFLQGPSGFKTKDVTSDIKAKFERTWDDIKASWTKTADEMQAKWQGPGAPAKGGITGDTFGDKMAQAKTKEIKSQYDLVGELAKLDEDRALKALTVEERITALKAKQKQIMEEIKAAHAGGDQKEADKLYREFVEARREQYSAEDELKKKKPLNPMDGIVVDELQKIGGGGGAFAPAQRLVDVGQQQLAVQRTIAENTKKTKAEGEATL